EGFLLSKKTKTVLAQFIPFAVFPKMSSQVLRLVESAESYACNAALTSYSAIAIVGPNSKLPIKQIVVLSQLLCVTEPDARFPPWWRLKRKCALHLRETRKR